MLSSLLCARPGCGGVAAAWLTYDYGGRRVWLDDAPAAAGDQWALCAEHARRLRPPRGWEQVDRRAGQAPPEFDNPPEFEEPDELLSRPA